MSSVIPRGVMCLVSFFLTDFCIGPFVNRSCIRANAAPKADRELDVGPARARARIRSISRENQMNSRIVRSEREMWTSAGILSPGFSLLRRRRTRAVGHRERIASLSLKDEEPFFIGLFGPSENVEKFGRSAARARGRPFGLRTGWG